MHTVLETIKQRRSMTSLTKTTPLDKATISHAIQEVLIHTPSAFNSQSSGALVIYEAVHEAFWDEVGKRVLPIVSDEKARERTAKKIEGFKGGDGTVIFLENQTINQSLRERFPLYSSSVDLWADQGQGFVQYGVWLALHELGFGVSLQHYNPLIDDYIYDVLNIERHFKVVGQMPFGHINGKFANKAFVDVKQRFFER